MSTRSIRGLLRFVSGKYESAEFPLGDTPISIGRESELDMVLHDDTVSPRHARISVADEGLVLEDLGSATGTYVNGERIRRAVLRAGDRIVIGRHTIEVRFSSV